MYEKMSKDELISQCIDKDKKIDYYTHELAKCNILTKNDIMYMYKCENNKALRILKIMYQMGYGNKIGKEYYISLDAHNSFFG